MKYSAEKSIELSNTPGELIRINKSLKEVKQTLKVFEDRLYILNERLFGYESLPAKIDHPRDPALIPKEVPAITDLYNSIGSFHEIFDKLNTQILKLETL